MYKKGIECDATYFAKVICCNIDLSIKHQVSIVCNLQHLITKLKHQHTSNNESNRKVFCCKWKALTKIHTSRDFSRSLRNKNLPCGDKIRISLQSLLLVAHHDCFKCVGPSSMYFHNFYNYLPFEKLRVETFI